MIRLNSLVRPAMAAKKPSIVPEAYHGRPELEIGEPHD